MADGDVATDESEFWERRRELTPRPTTAADVRERAEGRHRHLVLLADLSAAAGAFRPALDALDGFDCLAVAPPRNLHVTVKVVGNVVAEPTDAGEFAPDEEATVVDVLGDALAGAGAFEVAFPRLNLFPGVVYAEVADGGRFADLNRRVCERPELPVWDRDRDGFVPHVTLAQFVRRAGYDRVVDHLERERSLDAGPHRVEAVELVALDLAERYPPPETVATFDLGTP